MVETTATETTKDFTLPEGCLSCGSDLPVRVTASGAQGVCKHCGCFSRPQLRMTHQGLSVSYLPMGEA